MGKYLLTPPFARRPVTINTLCVVGACTCIMIKMAVEKAFKTLGVSELDIDVQPTVEDSPRGDRSGDPDIIITVGLRANEFRAMMPNTIVIEMHDLAKQDQTVREVRDALLDAGWLKEDAR